jgi:hypothetical protein
MKLTDQMNKQLKTVFSLNTEQLIFIENSNIKSFPNSIKHYKRNDTKQKLQEIEKTVTQLMRLLHGLEADNKLMFNDISTKHRMFNASDWFPPLPKNNPVERSAKHIWLIDIQQNPNVTLKNLKSVAQLCRVSSFEEHNSIEFNSEGTFQRTDTPFKWGPYLRELSWLWKNLGLSDQSKARFNEFCSIILEVEDETLTKAIKRAKPSLRPLSEEEFLSKIQEKEKGQK